MKKILSTQHTQHKGFTLLFALLVSTLVVSIGASIISIATRQIILSGTSRESQYAYYAASTALNCAYYWDRGPVMPVGLTNKVVFGTPADPNRILSTDSNANQIQCSGMSIVTDSFAEWAYDSIGVTIFKLKIKDITTNSISSKELCAEAKVTKTAITGGSGDYKVIIETKGYNTCTVSDPRRVERGLFQEYQS